MEFGSEFVWLNTSEKPLMETIEEEEESETVTVAERYQRHQMASGDDGETCLVDILDSAGQEEYSCMREQVRKKKKRKKAMNHQSTNQANKVNKLRIN